MKRLAPLVLALLLGPARAEEPQKFVLRVATVSPDGTAWAREAKAYDRDVELATKGALRIKFYWGGVAGDDVEVMDRIRKGQLDGAASGGPLCERLAPSTRVLGIPGLFQDRDEVAHVMHLLRPVLQKEAQHEGFYWVGSSTLGPAVIFSRNPIRTWTDLRATKLWEWDLFEYAIKSDRSMGLNVAALPLLDAKRAYDTKQVDGFLAIPAAALAFQWSTQARYITDLRTRYLITCVVMSSRAFDRLPVAFQQEIISAGAKVDARIEDVGRRLDDLLLNGLFAKQGLTPVPASERLRSEFFEATRQARLQLGEKVVSPELLARVVQMLSDYRAEHRKR
jgi:TRAP-type C4-dicarboxylate transport system substrate-binding protein